MVKRRSRDNEAQLDELGSDPGQVGSDSAGQSGDTEGLSQIADAADESVEELADTDQAYEAEAVSGVEDADDHLRGVYAPVRIVPGQIMFRRRTADNSGRGRRGTDTFRGLVEGFPRAPSRLGYWSYTG